MKLVNQAVSPIHRNALVVPNRPIDRRFGKVLVEHPSQPIDYAQMVLASVHPITVRHVVAAQQDVIQLNILAW